MLNRSFTGTLIEPSFESIANPAKLCALFEQEFSDAPPSITALESEFSSHPTSSLVTIQCYPWVHGGRLALIGDAAHTMVPFLGQGMNAGFEDCQTLLDCLDLSSEWETALLDYQRLRKPNCDAVTELSRRHFAELSEHVGDPRFIVQKKLEQKIHGCTQISSFPYIPGWPSPPGRTPRRSRRRTAWPTCFGRSCRCRTSRPSGIRRRWKR